MAGRLVGFAVGRSAFDVSGAFFLVSDAVGEGFETGAEVGDFSGDPGEGVRVVALVAVVFDNGSELRVAVEDRSAETGVVNNGGEGDGAAVVGEVAAGGFDGFEGCGNRVPVWAMSVSSRSRSRWCRSLSSIHPLV